MVIRAGATGLTCAGPNWYASPSLSLGSLTSWLVCLVAGAYFSGAMRDEDETGFQYVETSQRTTQPRFTRFTRHFNQRGRGRGTDGRGAGGGGGFRHGRGRMQLPQRQSKYRTAMRQDFQRRTWIHRSASVEVRPTWKVFEAPPQSSARTLINFPPSATVSSPCPIIHTPHPSQPCSTRRNPPQSFMLSSAWVRGKTE